MKKRVQFLVCCGSAPTYASHIYIYIYLYIYGVYRILYVFDARRGCLLNQVFLASALQNQIMAKNGRWKMLSSGFEASCAGRKLLPMVPILLESTGKWTGQDSEKSPGTFPGFGEKLWNVSWIRGKVMKFYETFPGFGERL